MLQDYSNIPAKITSKICTIIWNASKYLRGSVSTEIPYEVEYSLSLALKDWVTHKCVISTALLNDRHYHFCPLDTWKEIKLLLPDFDYDGFDALLIQIALPRIYRHKPLYYIPLYHELGHFIDNHFQITETSFLLNPVPLPPGATPQQVDAIKRMVTLHRMEYFADLFAACYLGHENYKFLQKISASDPGSDPNVDSGTHPATNKRVAVAQDFLNGNRNQVVDVFQQVLDKLGLNRLEIKYSNPDLAETFGNLRPYTIANNSEVHGVFESAWNYFEDAVKKASEPWKDIDEEDISRIINDLTEKTIRNKVITEKWKNAAT